MNHQENSITEKDKLLQLLEIQDTDHDSILASYKEQNKAYQDKMETAADIKERIAYQNLMIALDDIFLAYQSSLIY